MCLTQPFDYHPGGMLRSADVLNTGRVLDPPDRIWLFGMLLPPWSAAITGVDVGLIL
jgi:hypothetical protein